jgi:hypothetical protein
MSLKMNSDFKLDHSSFIMKLYQFIYHNRFLLTADDKKTISDAFSEIGINKLGKHLDLYKEVGKKELQKQISEKFKI